jgi:hypothetical protein
LYVIATCDVQCVASPWQTESAEQPPPSTFPLKDNQNDTAKEKSI